MAWGAIAAVAGGQATDLYLKKRQGDKASKLAKQQLELNKMQIALAKRGLVASLPKPVNHLRKR
jgi:hypothetical protein